MSGALSRERAEIEVLRATVVAILKKLNGHDDALEILKSHAAGPDAVTPIFQPRPDLHGREHGAAFLRAILEDAGLV